VCRLSSGDRGFTYQVDSLKKVPKRAYNAKKALKQKKTKQKGEPKRPKEIIKNKYILYIYIYIYFIFFEYLMLSMVN